MSAPTAPPGVAKFGDGTLSIGETGTPIDCSCLINGARIVASKDKADDTVKLCGLIRPGATTYTYALSGNVDVDAGNESGLFALSQSAPGSEQPFTFTPNDEAGTTATGVLIIDPLDFGADAHGDDLTSDFEFSLTGPPIYTYAAPIP